MSEGMLFLRRQITNSIARLGLLPTYNSDQYTQHSTTPKAQSMHTTWRACGKESCVSGGESTLADAPPSLLNVPHARHALRTNVCVVFVRPINSVGCVHLFGPSHLSAILVLSDGSVEVTRKCSNHKAFPSFLFLFLVPLSSCGACLHLHR